MVEREWGAAGHWPARAFGVLAAGPIFVGTYSYALGLTAGLAASARSSADAGGSPRVRRADARLQPACVRVPVPRPAVAALVRQRGRYTLVFTAAIAGIGAVQLAALLFPSSGPYPFRLLELDAVVLSVTTLGAALALRARHGAL